VGSTVGDDQDMLSRIAGAALARWVRKVDTNYDVWQVHSADVVCTDSPRRQKHPIFKADAIITNKVGVDFIHAFLPTVSPFCCLIRCAR